MTVRRRLIQELMLYKFELGRNTVEATKNICRAKDESLKQYSNKVVEG